MTACMHEADGNVFGNFVCVAGGTIRGTSLNVGVTGCLVDIRVTPCENRMTTTAKTFVANNASQLW